MNVSKFSFAEAHSDNTGKSSNTKMNGTVIIWTGCVGFILSTIGLLIGIQDTAITATVASGVIGIGAGLSGYSKKKGVEMNKDNNN